MVRSLLAASCMVAGVAAWSGTATAEDKEPGPTYRMVGDYTSVNGFAPLRVEAIGLVVGLNKTGGDPPPGVYREQVMTLMRQNDVEHPEKLLASRNVTAVILRAHVPPGARKGDLIDVDVFVLPNDNETTSLRGGYLLPVELGQKFTAGGQLKDGRKFVSADGPILLKDQPNSINKDENATKIGRILGRGKIKEDRDFIITINKDHRNSRLAKEIGVAINGRFFDSRDKGKQKGVANAKNHTEIHVTVPPQYKYNVVRFLHVCRRVPFRNGDSARTAMIRDLKQNLMDPSKTYDAALRLEALGLVSVSHLKEAMSSPHQIVRFSAAESLAYLGDARGLKELAALAEADSLYRAYAIAALASPRMPQAQLMLTKLLHAPGAETRYGAFRALSLVDKNDPLIMGEKLADDCTLHVIATNAEPMVHVASHFRPEIVLFGKDQKLAPPVMLRVADHLIVQHEGQGEKIIITSIRAGKQPIREEASTDVADVIRKAAKVGAKYPDIVELLRTAASSGCLQSRLEINALPKPVSIATLAQGGDNDMQQLPTGLPSIFQDEVVPPEEPKKAPEAVKKEEPKKKPWWKFSWLVN
jgi:flagellar basal body P-ring protein FlgI